jgi:hypothetical protein
VLNASNAAVVIETMRNIAEHILWGDQHDPTFFEYFLEKNVLSFMLSLGAPPDVDAKVKIQLIQTLSMMIENIRTHSSLCMCQIERESLRAHPKHQNRFHFVKQSHQRPHFAS